MKKMKCFSEENPDCKGIVYPVKVDEVVKNEVGTITLHDLEILQCDTCKEKFYPSKAIKKISAYKKYSGKFVLRVDPALHSELSTKAKQHHRSLNQEVIHLLEEALQG